MNNDERFYYDLGIASGQSKGLCTAYDIVRDKAKELGIEFDTVLAINSAILDAAPSTSITRR